MRDAEASDEARATHPASPIPHPAAPPARASPSLSHPEPSRPVTTKLPVILAITGASGAPYGVRLLEVLALHQVPVWLMIDRKSVVEGKSVDLGGCRIIIKK